jgi:hypothetical protein
MMVDDKIETIATIDSDFKKIIKEISEFSNIKIIDK